MQYLATSALSVSIWSSDANLAESRLLVRAHAKATVARLLLYIHETLRQRAVVGLGSVHDYELHYKFGPLPPSASLVSIDTSGVSPLRLRLEKKPPQNTVVEAGTLDLDALTTTNVEFQLNVLSTEKILSHVERGVPLSSTLSKLRDTALQLVNEYENTALKNICGVKDHTGDDFVGFNVAGKSQPMTLSPGSDSDDLKLCDILGIDFAPNDVDHCTLMFKLKHDQNLENAVSIEFVSDVTLSMNKMVVTADTTVLEVKEFICSVYAHALRLAPYDVKLIYKGQLLHENNYAGSPSKVLEYISDSRNAKVHVQVSQDYNEPGPGFWSELFSNSDRFSFAEARGGQGGSFASRRGSDPPRSHNQPTLTGSTETSGFERATGIRSRETGKQTEYMTTSGRQIERTGETYEKVMVSGREYFIQAHNFKLGGNVLDICGKRIFFSDEDSRVDENALYLSPRAMAELELRLGCLLVRPQRGIGLAPTPTLHTDDVLPAVDLEEERFARVKSWIETIMKTIYLMLRNSVLPFIIFLQIANFIPTGYIICGVLLILGRALWSSTEIWESWRELLANSNARVLLTDSEARQLEFALRERLNREFYATLKDALAVKEVLMQRLQTIGILRHAIASEFGLELSESLPIFVPQLLERCASSEFNDIRAELLDRLFEPLRTQTLRNLRNLHALSDPETEFLTYLRDYLRQQSTTPWYKPVFFARMIRVPWRRVSDFYNGGLMRRVVTDPRCDGVLLGLLKNFVLFFLLFWPSFQTQFEDIMARRLFDRHRADESRNSHVGQELDQTNDQDLPHDAADVLPEARELLQE
ncbi:LAMI_0G10946g1_1 [Lachancea mirantina]|uniref:LAMI_0G10946g1_1 n=1 Tax=Lachancea mirantina TaxID=1230905 RepID=A0A1G4KAU8_9SACH|nr:LAMI_0G10946g1_1 [Lachancea mirantina]